MKIGKKHTYVKTLDRKSCLISFIIGVESFRLRFLRVWFVLLQHVWNRYIVGQDNLCIRFCVFSFHYCSALMHSIEMDQLRKSRQIFDRLENLLPSLCFFSLRFVPFEQQKRLWFKLKNTIQYSFCLMQSKHIIFGRAKRVKQKISPRLQQNNWHIEFNEDKLADKNGKSIQATVFIPQPGNFATLFLPFLSTIVYSSIASTEMEMHLISYFEGSFFVWICGFYLSIFYITHSELIECSTRMREKRWTECISNVYLVFVTRKTRWASCYSSMEDVSFERHTSSSLLQNYGHFSSYHMHAIIYYVRSWITIESPDGRWCVSSFSIFRFGFGFGCDCAQYCHFNTIAFVIIISDFNCKMSFKSLFRTYSHWMNKIFSNWIIFLSRNLDIIQTILFFLSSIQ